MFSAERFAERVRALRVARGWSQGDLAERIGRSRSAIAYIETLRREPMLSTAAAIAGALGVTVDELISGRDRAA